MCKNLEKAFNEKLAKMPAEVHRIYWYLGSDVVRAKILRPRPQVRNRQGQCQGLDLQGKSIVPKGKAFKHAALWPDMQTVRNLRVKNNGDG